MGKHAAWTTFRATRSKNLSLTSAVDDATTITSDARQQVWDKGGGNCHYCNVRIMTAWFHVDHKVPKCKGGTNDLSNLLATCRKCNVAKGVRTYEDFVNLLKRDGLKWRDTEYRLQSASFATKGDLSRIRGQSNPIIGQRYKLRTLLKSDPEGGEGGYTPNSNEKVCGRCSKPIVGGRISTTLSGERVHTSCYVRGGRR